MFSIVLKSPVADVKFKIEVNDSVSKFFREVILAEHYLYSHALQHLQSVNQGKDWKAQIEYAVNVDCEKLSGFVYRSDRFSRNYEMLDTDQFKLYYIPISNTFYLMNFSDSSYRFDFIDIEQSMTA
ncbi:hypothetical protein [Pseudomonas putida]|uniref:hypothetical protein n=1 Tax=Pseudomonas putida TaxID=303 RepID=UPI0037C540B0